MRDYRPPEATRRGSASSSGSLPGVVRVTVERPPRTRAGERTQEGRIYDRFTDCAKTVLLLAGEEAERLGCGYQGTEHILLGLVRREVDGVAAKILGNMGIDLDKIRMEVEKIIRTGPSFVTMIEQHFFTPLAKKVLELSEEEAGILGHRFIGTGHLLLGLIKEPKGTAAQLLLNLGIQLSDVRELVLDCLAADYVDDERGPR